MKKFISLSTILFQLFITFVALFVIYLIFALLDMDEFDMITEGAFLIFQPIFAIILSTLTIVACIIVGLPIRLLPRVKMWWSSRPIIPFITLTIGIILLLLSLNANLTETRIVTIDGIEREKEIPNYSLSLTGWFMTAFSLLHFYPMTVLKWLKDKALTKVPIEMQAALVDRKKP
jgi:hypothetical protein